MAPSVESSQTQPLVCVLAYDGLCTFEFGIGVEVFGLPRPEFERWYRYAVIAVEPGPLHAMGGVKIVADHGLSLLKEASLVLVPGWRGATAPVPPELITAIREASENGARIASICSGVFVLAAAGLLDGRRATTHWRYTDALKQRYPNINVDPDVLYIDEGHVLTSAGSAAGLDLCLHIVRNDFGSEYANAVARRLVLPAQREGGQRQFIIAPVPRERGGRIGPLLDEIRGSLDEPWPVTRMAKAAGMSSRTLARRFQEITGGTPIKWLTTVRVARAAEILETSCTPLEDIVDACGFGSIETFRREFRRVRGVSPGKFRKSFGAGLSQSV